MEVNNIFSFQADSEIIINHYNNFPNYLIEFNDSVEAEYCVVYFSSNDLYYPNTEIAFKEGVLERNRFEWYKNRIHIGHKHIFFRDIKKQWYLTGVNKILNSPQKIADFIQEEAKGYKLIFVGSSAGGFISVIIGQMLNALRIYTFNGQFEIKSLLYKKDANINDPILYRNRYSKDLVPFYDAANFIQNPRSIYYFHSCNNKWDSEQRLHVRSFSLNVISFKTSNHGLPFLKTNLNAVLSLSKDDLDRLVGSKLHPLTFSIKMVGLINTIKGLTAIARFVLNKIYIHTLQNWKNTHN